MDPSDAPKIVVLALGNLIRSDDAIGLFALQDLEEDPRLPLHVSLVEGGTKGLELVPYICEASCLLVLDAVDVGANPGTVFRIAGEDLRSIPGNGNVHGLALADILNALRMMGHQPQEIVLLGVQPLITELGTALSTPVLRALPALVEAAVMELCRWGPSDESSMSEADGAAENGVAIPALEG